MISSANEACYSFSNTILMFSKCCIFEIRIKYYIILITFIIKRNNNNATFDLLIVTRMVADQVVAATNVSIGAFRL